MKTVIEMYTTMVPVIIAGIFNMIFVKMPFLNQMKKPIDRGRLLTDGRRLFGANKTYKGFVGMIVLSLVANVFWGIICSLAPHIENYNILYFYHDNTLWYNTYVGMLLGAAYAFFELPNSFVKRRIGIEAGKSKKGILGFLFVCIDQVDSLFGCALVIALFSPMKLWYYFAFVFLGGITHLALNVLLYMVKLKKNV